MLQDPLMDPGKAYNSIRVKNSIPVLAASAKMQCRTGIFCRQETGNRRQVETENSPLSPYGALFPYRGRMVNKWISTSAEFTELKQRPFFTIIQSSKENNTRAKRNPGSRKKHTQFKNI